MTELLTIVLAAGEGTRMRSARPKVLHAVGGLPIIGHVVRAAREAGSSHIAVITGPGHDDIRTAVLGMAPEARFFEQVERLGTAHAALQARDAWESAEGHVAVVYGDHPLLRGANFSLVIDKLGEGWDAAILGFEPEDPTGYGRFITVGDRLLEIREHKDASEVERAIGLCNACILAFKADVFRSLIEKVGSNNAQGEFYLTDLVHLANEAGFRVGYAVAPEDDVMGVNDRQQLARAEAIYQSRARQHAMRSGVTLIDPASVFFSYDTRIEEDVTVEPGVWFGPGVSIARGTTVHAFSHLEGCSVGEGASIGPFARLRPDAEVENAAKVGNFVEIKKARIGAGAKVNHLTYVGDADIGAGSNIGAGTVTCNYDGINKHRTSIGQGVFVGSNSSLVAPVSIGEGAYIASGSVITEDVGPDALAFGRARQVNKPGYAPGIRQRAQAIKDAKSSK